MPSARAHFIIDVLFERERVRAAAAVMGPAIEAMRSRSGVEFLSPPNITPAGLAFDCQMPDASDREVRSLLAQVSRLGQAAGGPQSRIEISAAAWPDALSAFWPPRPALRLTAFPRDDASGRDAVIQQAVSWLQGSEPVWTSVHGRQYLLESVDDAAEFAALALGVDLECLLATGPVERPRRSALISSPPNPILSLGTGFTENDPTSAARNWHELIDAGRLLAGLVYSAWARADDDWRVLGSVMNWGYAPPVASIALIATIPALAVLEPAPWLLIGPGHRARIAHPGATEPSGQLADQELAFGTIDEWLGPGAPRIRERARQQLAPLLLTMLEASAVNDAIREAR